MKYVVPNYRWVCHAELGRAYMTAENIDAAIKELQTAARLMPGLAQMHGLLSQAYRRAGRTADAERENAEFQNLKKLEDPLGVTTLRPLTRGAKQ